MEAWATTWSWLQMHFKVSRRGLFCNLQQSYNVPWGFLPHGTAVVSALDGTDDSSSVSRVLLSIQEVQHRLSIQVHGVIEVRSLRANLWYREKRVVERGSLGKSVMFQRRTKHSSEENEQKSKTETTKEWMEKQKKVKCKERQKKRYKKRKKKTQKKKRKRREGRTWLKIKTEMCTLWITLTLQMY